MSKASDAKPSESAPATSTPEVLVVAAPSSPLRALALAVVACALLVALGLVFYLFDRMRESDETATRSLERLERQIQQLEAGISYDSRRQRLLCAMRDEILRINPRIGLHEAYQYASHALEASEKYPTIPPLLLVALGAVESGFRADARSSADARGLYQIWPSTGRLLARALGWEFSEDLLHDPARNTEMAALYLDILFTVYNDPSLVLAEYNGGPRNAGLFRAGAADVAAETRSYVPKVLDIYDRLRSEHETGPDWAVDSLYRDRERLGKRLPTRVASERPPGMPEAARRAGE